MQGVEQRVWSTVGVGVETKSVRKKRLSFEPWPCSLARSETWQWPAEGRPLLGSSVPSPDCLMAVGTPGLVSSSGTLVADHWCH